MKKSRVGLRGAVAVIALALCPLLPTVATGGHIALAAAVPGGTFATLYSFAGGSDGSNPFGALLQGHDGNLYSTTAYNGSGGNGTVFTVTTAGALTTLHAFSGGKEGANPFVGLVQAHDGTLYGTTFGGGPRGAGTVFKITTAGVLTTLHAFTHTDGQAPHVLLLASDGNLYGTTTAGGPRNFGTVYRITPRGKLTTLHAFSGGTDGGSPQAGLIQAGDGNLYGTASQGGPSGTGVNGHGTVFKITLAGVLTTIYGFTDGSDGGQPLAGLIQARDGNLYGTTSDFYGTVFKLTTAGALTTLHAFAFGDGILTQGNARLLQARNGNLYGTAYGGGSNYGTIYQITTGGAFSVLHVFANADGANPSAGLIQAGNGTLYGTTSYGGSNGKGTIFTLSPS